MIKSPRVVATISFMATDGDDLAETEKGAGFLSVKEARAEFRAIKRCFGLSSWTGATFLLDLHVLRRGFWELVDTIRVNDLCFEAKLGEKPLSFDEYKAANEAAREASIAKQFMEINEGKAGV